MKKAAVIGAGIGGIAAAARLAAKGYVVDVFEKNSGPGGKLIEFTQQGYRFDAGPSLFTMPHLVTELFELLGEDPLPHFRYTKLDELCRYFFDNGTQYHTYTEAEKTAEAMARATGESKQHILDFLSHSKKLYELTADFFIFSSLHEPKKYLHPSFLKKLLQIRTLRLHQTMHGSLQKFFSTPSVINHFSRYATYNGSDPYQAPATLNIIPHLEYHLGAYLPAQGMYHITQALVGLCERHGVTYYYNHTVEKILHQQGKVTGIIVNGESKNYELVVNDTDIYFFYHQLLPDVPKPHKILGQERSSSVLVFNWGMKKSFTRLGLHNIFFSTDYQQEFRALFSQKTIASDPTIYLYISSKHIPADAPVGCENWFTLVNAPADAGQNWDELIQQTRSHVLAKLGHILNENIDLLIKCETILNPKQIAADTGSYLGALYGNSSNSKWAAFLRHPNRLKRLKNLYFVGGSVHPGGGIPLCLSSAKIIDPWIQPA